MKVGDKVKLSILGCVGTIRDLSKESNPNALIELDDQSFGWKKDCVIGEVYSKYYDLNDTSTYLFRQISALELVGSATSSAPLNQAIVDDHVCIRCKNTKCSKQEKSCWRCGEPINS